MICPRAQRYWFFLVHFSSWSQFSLFCQVSDVIDHKINLWKSVRILTYILCVGYVLSYRVLYRLNQGCVPSIIRDSLASASLRRIFRLLPLAAFSIIFSHIILLCGGYDLANSKKIGWWWIENCTPHWITTNWFSQTLEALKDIVSQPIWSDSFDFSTNNTPIQNETLINLDQDMVLRKDWINVQHCAPYYDSRTSWISERIPIPFGNVGSKKAI